MTLLGFEAPALAAIAIATLLAFVVRGLSGFGSSMIGIGALSMLLPPAQVVPAFLAIELLTTVNLLPGVWRQIDWRSLRWVIAGCALARPHSSLGPGLPEPRLGLPVPLQEQRHQIPTGYRVRAKPILGGLHHEYGLEKIAA